MLDRVGHGASSSSFKADESRLFVNDDDVDFILFGKVLDLTRATERSEIYKMGCAPWDNMLNNIRNWAIAFLHPTNPQVSYQGSDVILVCLYDQ